MASALDKSIISRLMTGLQATPAVKREMVETLGKLLQELQQPHVTEAEAEKRLRKWLESAPPHAATVLQHPPDACPPIRRGCLRAAALRRRVRNCTGRAPAPCGLGAERFS